jgi:hypothetical protein
MRGTGAARGAEGSELWPSAVVSAGTMIKARLPSSYDSPSQAQPVRLVFGSWREKKTICILPAS